MELFDFTKMMQPQMIGKLPDGRPIVRNADGSISTHRNMIVNFDKDFYVMPTMYGGKQYNEDAAVDLIKRNNFVDPDTGKELKAYPSLEEAEAAENKQHGFLNEIAALLSKGQR